MSESLFEDSVAKFCIVVGFCGKNRGGIYLFRQLRFERVVSRNERRITCLGACIHVRLDDGMNFELPQTGLGKKRIRRRHEVGDRPGEHGKICLTASCCNLP